MAEGASLNEWGSYAGIDPPGLNFDFCQQAAKFFITASLLIIVLGVMSLIVRGGFNEGIDFSGGTLVQLRLSQPADLRVIRETLATLGIDTAIVQHYGDEREVLIRVAQHAAAGQDIGKQVQHTLQDRLGDSRLNSAVSKSWVHRRARICGRKRCLPCSTPR